MENAIHFAEFALGVGALIWGHICLLAYKWTSAWSYAWTPWSQQLPNRLKAWRSRACQWEPRKREKQPRPRPPSCTALSGFHSSAVAPSLSPFLCLPGQQFNFQFAWWLLTDLTLYRGFFWWPSVVKTIAIFFRPDISNSISAFICKAIWQGHIMAFF